MNLTYKRATYEDIEILTKTRIEVLRAANQLSGAADMSEVERESYNYYQKALCDGSHIAYLVFDGNCFVGAGGVSFFQVMPTYHNSSGKKAYIMNMYTKPEYRRMGIATKTLDMLIQCQLVNISRSMVNSVKEGAAVKIEALGFKMQALYNKNRTL